MTEARRPSAPLLINPVRYAATARYLASLPQGLNSYPDCKVRADAHEGLRERFAQIGHHEDLPPLIREFFLGTYRDDWLPEVAGSAIVHLVRDVGFTSDEDYSRWAYENNVRLFKKPYYRVLVYLLSTTLVLRGAARTWKAMHTGSSMEAGPVQKVERRLQTRATLRFPAHVFDVLDMRNISSGFMAVLEASRASEPRVEMHDFVADSASFVMSWNG